MASSYDVALPLDGALPLATAQRIQITQQLHDLWRETVGRLTDLSIRFHSDLGGSADDTSAELTDTRRMLVEIEAALRRLESGTYGRCDACERRIPFERLELRPQHRYCVACGGLERP